MNVRIVFLENYKNIIIEPWELDIDGCYKLKSNYGDEYEQWKLLRLIGRIYEGHAIKYYI